MATLCQWTCLEREQQQVASGADHAHGCGHTGATSPASEQHKNSVPFSKDCDRSHAMFSPASERAASGFVFLPTSEAAGRVLVRVEHAMTRRHKAPGGTTSPPLRATTALELRV